MFQFVSDARDCESYLRQLQETIKRQYTCDRNSRLSKLEDLLQDSMVLVLTRHSPISTQHPCTQISQYISHVSRYVSSDSHS